MSPEQALGQPLDRRSDVFSAGSVLYELCTGRSAFNAPNEVDMIFEVREAKPTDPRTFNPELPPMLHDIMARAMMRSRDDRFPSALAFRDALIRFLQENAPDYRRSRLARFMKLVWEAEIEEDLRMLEDCVLDLSDDAPRFGRNLLADELPRDAPYSNFSPQPTRTDGEALGAPRPAPRVTKKLR